MTTDVSESEDSLRFWLKAFLCVAVLFFLAFTGICILAIFVASECDELMVEAVKRGYAVWAVDEKGGTEWQWVEPKPQREPETQR